jgi:hypothetical protein
VIVGSWDRWACTGRRGRRGRGGIVLAGTA